MDTFSPWASADLEQRFSASGQAELRDAVLRQHATLPFYPGAPFSRMLWLLSLCSEGIQTRVVLPLDDRLDLPVRKLPGHCACPHRSVGAGWPGGGNNRMEARWVP